MIRVVVSVIVKEGMKNEFLKRAQGLISESRKEKGCIEYNLVDSTIENQLYFIELWETREDLKIHAGAQHSLEYKKILDELRSKESFVEIYETNNI